MQAVFLQNYTFVLNILLASIMLVYNFRSNRNILFLFIFLVSAALFQLMHKTLFFGGSEYLFATLYQSFSPIVFLTGPAIYLFLRKLLNPHLEFKVSDLLHLLPFFLQLISVTPYIFTSFDYKLQIAQHLVQYPADIIQVDLKLWYPNIVNFIFKFLSNFSYIVLSVILLYRHHKMLKNKNKLNWNKHDQNLIWMWLLLLVFLVIFVMLFGIMNYMVFEGNTNNRENVLGTTAMIIRIFLLIIPTSILIFPHVLTEFKVKTSNTPGVKQPANNSLSFEGDIRSYMQEQKPFLDPKFNRNDLCKALNISLQQMQQCLNGSTAKTFVELKNEYRIEYSIELLRGDKSKEFTLEAIANHSGFNSYSNYFTVFKEVQGVTPKQWIKTNLPG